MGRSKILLACTAELRKQLFSPVGLSRPLLISEMDICGPMRERWWGARCDSDRLLRGRYPPEAGRREEGEEEGEESLAVSGGGCDWSFPLHPNFGIPGIPGNWLKKLLAMLRTYKKSDHATR